MTTLHQLEPITLDFFDEAPLRVQCSMVAKCTPETLFETLRGDTVWTQWAGVIQGVNWTSEKPYARSSTRDVESLNLRSDLQGRAEFSAGDVRRVQAQAPESPMIVEFASDTHRPVFEELAPDVIPDEPIVLELDMMRVVA